MAAWREAKHRYRLLMWPIFDISGDCSDSLARFQAYAAIAYGADGIWYFTYNGGGIMRLPKESEGKPSPAQTVEQVHQRLKPNYGPVAETNWRLRVWGQRLAGNDSAGVFSTGWNNRSWPFPEDLDLSGFDQVVPGPDKLIEKMSPDLLAGVLVRDGEAPQVMVVDCRVSKQYNTLPPREVEIDFHSTVQEVRIVSDQPQASDSLVPGSHVKLVLLAGKGHLLELSSLEPQLDNLCTSDSIYAPAEMSVEESVPLASISEDELQNIRAAKLGVDVAGANPEEQYHKPVFLNGQKVGLLPPNTIQSWQWLVMDLTPEQLRHIQRHNTITIDHIRSDAWKIRQVVLAVQKEVGTWIKSASFEKTYASEGWDYFEGEAFPEGEQLEIELDFR